MPNRPVPAYGLVQLAPLLRGSLGGNAISIESVFAIVRYLLKLMMRHPNPRRLVASLPLSKAHSRPALRDLWLTADLVKWLLPK